MNLWNYFQVGSLKVSFGLLFDRHAPAIHGYIARRLGRDAADDLVAETFLLAFGQRHRYDQGQPSARPPRTGPGTGPGSISMSG